jgi:di/tricarboxylate transporter
MRLFNKYKFSNKSQTLGGVISTMIDFGALACVTGAVYISFKKSGEAGMEVGALGLLAIMLSIIGTVIGLISFKEDDKFYTFSWVGSLMGGMLTVFMLSVILMGLGI